MKKSLTILVAICLYNCSGGDSKKLDTLQDEVMAIHDEVMPKLGEIMALKEQLNGNLGQLDSTSVEYKAKKMATDSLSSLLTEADNGMMDWMEEYNADTLKVISAEEGLKYLSEEKNKIGAIKELTNKNIEAVKKYLNK